MAVFCSLPGGLHALAGGRDVCHSKLHSYFTSVAEVYCQKLCEYVLRICCGLERRPRLQKVQGFLQLHAFYASVGNCHRPGKSLFRFASFVYIFWLNVATSNLKKSGFCFVFIHVRFTSKLSGMEGGWDAGV